MTKETETNQKKKIGELLRENLQKITILLVSIIYITQGIFELTKKDTTILDILGNIGMSIVVGFIISSSFTSMGLKEGRGSDLFQNSLKVYGDTKVKATPHFDKLSSWCEYKNAQELEYKKKEIIQGVGLNWKAYKFGYYDEHTEKLNDIQKKAIEDAKNAKIYKLSSQDLLSDLPNKYGKFNKRESKFGQTEREYKNKNNIYNFISKVAIAIVCGLYGLEPLINEENFKDVMAGVLWNAMQIVIWITFGVTKYINAKSFMEDEYRQTHIIQKTEYLNEFTVTMQNNPKVIEKYDEDLEINKYIEEYLKTKKEGELKNEQKTILV